MPRIVLCARVVSCVCVHISYLTVFICRHRAYVYTQCMLRYFDFNFFSWLLLLLLFPIEMKRMKENLSENELKEFASIWSMGIIERNCTKYAKFNASVSVLHSRKYFLINMNFLRFPFHLFFSHFPKCI